MADTISIFVFAMTTFNWQSIDGNWSNPESWGVLPIVSGVDASINGSTTISLPGATDLSSVAAGDVIRLEKYAEGMGGAVNSELATEYYRITAVDDGLDTVTVDSNHNPSSTASSIIWTIFGDLPTEADTTIFGEFSQVSVTQGLDRSDDVTGAGNGIMRVFPTYSGNIGTPSNPLVISYGNTSGELYFEGTGSLNWKERGAETYKITINSASAVLHSLGGQGLAEGLEFLIIGLGRVELLGNFGVQWAQIAQQGAGTFTTHVEIQPEAVVLSILVSGGIVFTSSNDTNGFAVLGGEVTIRKEVSSGISCKVLGGVLVYNGTGTILNFFAIAGFLDFSQDARAKTITNLYIMPGMVANIPPNVTVTNQYPTLDTEVGRGL